MSVLRGWGDKETRGQGEGRQGEGRQGDKARGDKETSRGATRRQGEGRQGEGRQGDKERGDRERGESAICDLEFGIWFLGFGISKFERTAIEH